MGERKKARDEAKVKEELAAVNKAIKQRKLRWKAGETSMSKLSEEEMGNRLGSSISEERMSSIVKRQEEKEKKRSKSHTSEAALRPEWDWRNVSGVNWITTVKDQGNCGSCVAFTVAGVLEMMTRSWIYGDPTATIDLSEAHLFFCNNRQCNVGDPRWGWNIPDALNYVEANGVPDEGCYPYADHNQPCSTCGNWTSRIDDTQITHWRKTTNVTEMKELLRGHGCLATDFLVYRDFYYYVSGVYEHTYGVRIGAHAVMVVGYNDADGCWICKNSWGTGWGENGFFRIAYGECGIDNEMYAMDFVGVTLQTEGKVTLLRVHDKGTKYGPNVDQLDAEVITKLDNNPDKAFGFQLRSDANEADHLGMLDLLRDAFNRGTRVRIDYTVNGLNTGRIIRLARC